MRDRPNPNIPHLPASPNTRDTLDTLFAAAARNVTATTNNPVTQTPAQPAAPARRRIPLQITNMFAQNAPNTQEAAPLDAAPQTPQDHLTLMGIDYRTERPPENIPEVPGAPIRSPNTTTNTAPQNFMPFNLIEESGNINNNQANLTLFGTFSREQDNLRRSHSSSGRQWDTNHRHKKPKSE